MDPDAASPAGVVSDFLDGAAIIFSHALGPHCSEDAMYSHAAGRGRRRNYRRHVGPPRCLDDALRFVMGTPVSRAAIYNSLSSVIGNSRMRLPVAW